MLLCLGWVGNSLLMRNPSITYNKNEHRHAEVVRRYMIQKPEDYHHINRLCGVCPPFLSLTITSPAFCFLSLLPCD